MGGGKRYCWKGEVRAAMPGDAGRAACGASPCAWWGQVKGSLWRNSDGPVLPDARGVSAGGKWEGLPRGRARVVVALACDRWAVGQGAASCNGEGNGASALNAPRWQADALATCASEERALRSGEGGRGGRLLAREPRCGLRVDGKAGEGSGGVEPLSAVEGVAA